MIITKKAIPRRTILRGLGATLALPVLDSMVPAFTAVVKSQARPVNRFGVVYVPNGVGSLAAWTPAGEGRTFEFSQILKPLEPFRDRVLVMSGLNSKIWPGERSAPHARASTKFLTNIPPKATTGSDLLAGVSMDQTLAKELG